MEKILILHYSFLEYEPNDGEYKILLTENNLKQIIDKLNETIEAVNNINKLLNSKYLKR